MCWVSIKPRKQILQLSLLLSVLRIVLGDLLPSKAWSHSISGIWALPECRITRHYFTGSSLRWFHLQFTSSKKCPSPPFPPCKIPTFFFFADPYLLEFVQVSYHSTFQSSWQMSGDSTKAHGLLEIMSDSVTQLLCHWDRQANFPVFQNSYWISPSVFLSPLFSHEWLCGFCCSRFNIIKTLWFSGFGLT